jgi:hypothetical protein
LATWKSSVAGALCLGTAVSAYLAIVANEKAEEASINETAANHNAGQAIKARERALAKKKNAEDAQLAERTARLETESGLADMFTSHGLHAGANAEAATAVLWFTKAAQLAPHDPEAQVENRLRARNLLRQAVIPVATKTFASGLGQLDFNPTGQLLLIRSGSRWHVWDWAENRLLNWLAAAEDISQATWSPDGRWLAFGFQSGQVLILDSANGKPVHDLKRPGAIRSLAFSRDNRYLAIGSDLVRIWNTETREFLKLTYAHPSPVHSLVFKRQGKRLATATEAGKAQVFRVGPGETDDKPLFDPVPHAPSQYSAPQFFDLVRSLVTIGDISP